MKRSMNVMEGPAVELDPDLSELAALYASGALSEGEKRSVEARLEAGDGGLSQAVYEAQEALVSLALQLSVAPPPALKTAVLGRVFDDSPGDAAQERTAALASPADAVHASPQAPLSSPVMPLSALADSGFPQGALPHDTDWVGLSRVVRHVAERSPSPRTPSRERRTALLVIDMLHDYVDQDGPLVTPTARSIVPALRSRLELERRRGTRIFYVNDHHSEDDPDFDVWPRHAVRGSRGAQVIPPLAPRRGDVIVPRLSYSAFFENDLDERLKAEGVTELILTGQAADACVMMTAIDALMRGYEVEVPEDCVAGLTEEGKVFALRRIALLKPWQPNRKR